MKTIVKRRLEFAGPDGKQKATVRILAPFKDGNAWRCQYRMKWPGHDKTYGAMGEDEWQALHLAMHVVPSAIYATEDFKQGRIGIWGKTACSYEDLAALFDVKPVEGPLQ